MRKQTFGGIGPWRLLKSNKFREGHKVGTVFVAPAEMMRAFPRPSAIYSRRYADGKVDRCWVFSKEVAGVMVYFQIYAFSATSHYSEDYPSPEQYWKGTDPKNLSIYGSATPAEFVEWLLLSGLDAIKVVSGARIFYLDRSDNMKLKEA